MKNIAEIDSNFKVEQTIDKSGLKFYDCTEAPLRTYGVFKEDGKFRRLSESVAKKVSAGVLMMHACTAGGRVRFMTDSCTIAICAHMEGILKMPHFAITGVAGFDIYADDVFVGGFQPPFGIENGYESKIVFADKKLRDITINFPLYSDVVDLYVGVDENCTITEAPAYINSKPAVYYGSSITHGGCASRPGNAYQSFVSRQYNLDYINLGFSGNAKGEDEMIEYIAGLDMSLFVQDYDHNAPTPEHLEATHEKLFKAVRSANPDMPIILMSRPKNILTPEEEKRRAIVEATYKNALASGDANVYFLDGAALTAFCGNDGTVDNCHPTDFGFASMAKAVCSVIESNKSILEYITK